MANTYGKVSGTFQEADEIYAKVSGTWEEIDEAYAKVSGTWQLVFSAFEATSFVTLSSGSGTFSVPDQANAIHIQAAVGAGGGAVGGADYDKAGGESSGAGGGSGAYISDKIFTVTGGETMTYSIGSGGSAGGKGYNTTGNAGTNTTLSGSSAGSLFTLTGGGGSQGINGGVQGPLRTNIAGVGGSATVGGTPVTSGNFRDTDGTQKAVTTNTSGPTGTFNQSGNGASRRYEMELVEVTIVGLVDPMEQIHLMEIFQEDREVLHQVRVQTDLQGLEDLEVAEELPK